jgi:hypothetical protein
MHHRVVCFAPIAVVWALLFCGVRALSAPSPLVISEFLASNASVLDDEGGDSEDWLELWNTSGTAINLEGWHLTDDPGRLTRWRFPAVTIAPGEFLVVFASGKDRRVPGAPLHANFQLDADGEYLALVQPDGETVVAEFAPVFPQQSTDVSFGLSSEGDFRFFPTPTPGAANGVGLANRVADPRFSVDRGFYQAPIDLVITSATPGAEIRYTTNGTPPTATTGRAVSGPIRISGTTVVRAAAFRAGWLPSNVDTHTYLFTGDIIRQSPNGAPPPGWPTTWGANSRDYGMDPAIVDHPGYRDSIEDALKALPSFCLTVHLPDLFAADGGIYANPGQDGRSWERPMSLELIHADGQDGFQIEGGVRIRGGFSRSTGNPKHAFRFFFRPEYGASRLTFPLFGDSGVDEFEGFDLRTFQNYSWSFQGDSSGTFLRDQFNRDVQLAMGHQGERGDYYHLYINGQYWGVFNTCERPEASYAESYFGGDKDEYDVIKVEAGPYVIVATDGTLGGWTQLYNLVRTGVDDVKYRRLLGQNPDGTPNPSYPVYVDPINLIDYMLIILYGGNLDAPVSNFLGNDDPNNFFAVWNRVTQDQGFQFFVHDAEHTLLNVNADRTGPYPAGDNSVTKSNPQWLWQKLQQSEEFRILVADRVRKHFFDGGALTPARARELYLRRRDEIELAVIAESARWGDAQRPDSPLTRDAHWVPAVNQNLDFIARRSEVVLNQLRADGLYPVLAAPQFNQPGGPVNPGFGLLMAPLGAMIYFTLDGSDPRRPGGALSPSARAYSRPVQLTESVTVKARIYEDGAWSALNEAEFIVAQTFNELFITEIHYHPAGSGDLDADEFEFLELKNVGTRQLDLSGVSFADGIRFSFPNGTRLAPGAFAILVSNENAFRQRYPNRAISGVYAGRLSNSGERLTVAHAVGTPIFSVSYETRPPWPQLADGQGFSLVPVQPNSNPAPDSPSSWRGSSQIHGSPGADDPAGVAYPVVVNEVLAHTDPPLLDSVELHNASDMPAAVGGWWLTDDRNEPRKFRLPAGVSIPARGFSVLSESDFNQPNGAPGSFSFSSHGDEVWLFAADGLGNLTGYSDGFGFPVSANGVSFGRHTNSVGHVSFPSQAGVTLGQANAGPRISPVIITEIHYHPTAGDAEFVEIHNESGTAVPLFDPLFPTNTWRIGGLGFSFPEALVLPAGGYAVVTASDPAGFRDRHGIPVEVPVFGPFTGALQDGGETLTLERPDRPDLLPDGTVLVPYVVEEGVSFQPDAPWPLQSGGGGASLERLSPPGYADDPASWRPSPGEPSPGGDNDGNRPPRVDAGADAEVESTVFPVEVVLAGSGTDDGLPLLPGHLVFEWTQVSGPGAVEFNDASGSNTMVRLPGTGVFTMRLTASDGDRSRSDEVILTTRRPGMVQAIIPAGATWKYLDSGQNPGTSWHEVGFDDSAWRTGPAQLGYGDGDEATVLRSTAGGTRLRAFYFRRTFSVADPATVTALSVSLLRDDGAMVCLNGELVFRSNMPEGEVTPLTWASEVVGGADESAFFEQEIDPSILRPGDNVLAVEVHQQSNNSTDVSFDVILEADVLAENRPPNALAGDDLETRVEEPVRLSGGFQDDGLPSPPGVVRVQWQQMSGPGPAVFSATNIASPVVRFPAPGTYVLSLAVHDGELSATDELTAIVAANDYQAWRERFFSAAELANPLIGGDDADPDQDGQSNLNEYQSGTDPRDAQDALRVSAERMPGGLRLILPVIEGRTYSVLRRASPESGQWEVARHVDPADCTCEVEIVEPLDGFQGERFYRVVTPRAP